MRIACPNCAAEYEVPAARLRPGKSVRCARCGTNWSPDPDRPDLAVPNLDTSVVVPPVDPATPPPGAANEIDRAMSNPPVPDLTAMDRLAASPASRPRHTSLIGAWLLTFVVLTGALVAVVGWRNTLVRVWPPSSRVLMTTGPSAPLPSPTVSKKPE